MTDDSSSFNPSLAGVLIQAPAEPDREWQHGSCLAIAEGAPGWDQDFGDRASPAMRAVQQLRREFELFEARQDCVANGEPACTAVHESDIARLVGEKVELEREIEAHRAKAADPLQRRLGASVDELTARVEQLCSELEAARGAQRQAVGRAKSLDAQVQEVLSLKQWSTVAAKKGSGGPAVTSWAIKLLAANAAEALHGENYYAEFRLRSPEDGEFLVCLQRLQQGARTPHDLRVEAEAACTAMRAALVEADATIGQLSVALSDADGPEDSDGTTLEGKKAHVRARNARLQVTGALRSDAGREILGSLQTALGVLTRIADGGCFTDKDAGADGKTCRQRSEDAYQWCTGCLAAGALGRPA